MIARTSLMARAGAHARNCHCPRCRHVRADRDGAAAARFVGMALAAVATLLAVLACTDPVTFGGIAIGAAMLLYAGSAAAFFRADNPADAGSARGSRP
jgi:uncharacterized paraquat-inducible protein A